MNAKSQSTALRFGIVALLALGLLATRASAGRASAADAAPASPQPKSAVPMAQPGSALRAEAETAPDIDRILKRGKLIVAMFVDDVGPFFMHTKADEFVGIDVALAKDIASQLGVQVEFNRSPDTFDGIVDLVANRQADVAISLLSDTLSRAMRVRFSDSYVELHQTLLVNRLQLAKRFPGAETPDQINLALNQPGVRIGVISGTSYVDFVRQTYPLATAVQYESDKVMEADVAKGTLFAMLYDEISIADWKYANPDGSLLLKIVVLNKQTDTIAIAVNREDVNLLAWLNLYLVKAKGSGFLDGLIDTYLKHSEWRTQ